MLFTTNFHGMTEWVVHGYSIKDRLVDVWLVSSVCIERNDVTIIADSNQGGKSEEGWRV